MNIILLYRFLLSSFFTVLLLIYRKETLRISLRECLLFLVLGILYASASEFLFMGYDYLTPGIASSIFFVYPAIVACILFFAFKEAFTRRTAICLCMTIAGVFIVSFKDTTFEINMTCVCVPILSAVFYSLYIITVNKAKINGSSLKIAFYSLLFCSLYYLIKALACKDSLLIPDFSILLNISVFALITTVLSSLTLVYAIQSIGSTPSSIMGALEPIVAVTISVSLFNEDLTFNLITGVVLIISGVTLSITSENSNYH